MRTTRKYSIEINFAKETKVALPQFIQGDSNILEFTVLENDTVSDLSNLGRIVANFKRPDKRIVSRLLVPENDVIVYKLGAEEMEAQGLANLELQFYNADNTQRVSTTTMRVQLMPNIGSDAIVANDETLTLLQSLFVEVEDTGNYALEQGDYASQQGLAAEQAASKANAEANSLAQLKTDVAGATVSANDAATHAQTQGDYAKEQADLTSGKLAELEGVNATQINERLNATDVQLAQNVKQQQVTPMIQPYDAYLEPYREIQIHDVENNLYATYSRVGENPTLEKSTDFGKTWTAKGQLPALCRTYTKVSKTGTIIAIEQVSTLQVNNPRMWRSTDDGATWTLVNIGLRFPPLGQQGITETPNGSILVGEYGNVANTKYRIMRSTDDGLTWNEVLASPGTDDWGDPGHIHSVTYDPIEKKFVAFMDRVASLAYGARIYTSSDDGATWQILGVVDSNTKPNFVSPMYFETHIAWGSDNERNGVVSRISRADFYAGRFDKVEDVAQLNKKVFYFTFPIRQGVWLMSMANETVASSTVPEGPGNYANELFIVSDNGKVVSGGLSHFQINTDVGSLSGNKISFPSYKFDRLDHKGMSWLNIVTGKPRPYAAMPYSQGYSVPTNNITIPSTIPNANMFPLTWKDNAGNIVNTIHLDSNNRLIVRNGIGANDATIRLTPEGEFEVLRGNLRRMYTLSDGTVVIPKLAVASNGVGVFASSGNPNSVVTAPIGSICLNWNFNKGIGLWVKETGSGNTGWIPITASAGSSSGRPTTTFAGMSFFDTTLGKPIWWSGAAWVDANGTTV